MTPGKIPHPIPYQGSKRQLATRILAHVRGPVETLVEPFAGSAAMTLAAAHAGRADRFLLGDALAPLAALWAAILEDAAGLADAYEAVWRAQLGRPRTHYDEVRAAFNAEGGAARLLFLLARCVKGAVRFNEAGAFNQSPDRRRLGTHPARMRASLAAAHALLAGRARVRAADYAELCEAAGPRDLVYLDPPWQGTSGPRDRRYVAPLDLDRFVATLDALNRRGVRYLVSLDGRRGDRVYGAALPAHLRLARVELPAGRSTQATLLGRAETTVESLYLSPAITGA